MKMSKALHVYKPGTKVHDTWYGNGIVTKRTKRRLFVKMAHEIEVWEYDATHVREFVRKGYKRGNIK